MYPTRCERRHPPFGPPCYTVYRGCLSRQVLPACPLPSRFTTNREANRPPSFQSPGRNTLSFLLLTHSRKEHPPVKEPSSRKSINASLSAMSKTLTHMGKLMREERKLEAQENERRLRTRDLKNAAEALDKRHA